MNLTILEQFTVVIMCGNPSFIPIRYRMMKNCYACVTSPKVHSFSFWT